MGSRREPFEISRKDGRSNAEVVIDFAKNIPAGTVVTYGQFKEVLEKGTNQTFTIQRIQGTINSSLRRMLRELARTFHNVRGEGYRLAKASDHTMIASGRERRGRRQMLAGMLVLRNVKWDEMDENQRLAHQGHLMIAEGMCQQMEGYNRRFARIDKAIEEIKKKQEEKR